MVSLRQEIAEALYNHWRSSDSELKVSWADAPDNLRGVFLRQADVVEKVIDGGS